MFNPKIFVVSDEVNLRVSISKLLEFADYQVEKASVTLAFELMNSGASTA